MIYILCCGFHHYLDVAAHERGVYFKPNGKLDELDDGDTFLLVKVWIVLKCKKIGMWDNADEAEEI